MQPNQQQDNVWISREEYERLQQQAQQPAPQVAPQPVVYSANFQVAPDEPAKVSSTQAITGALLALGLFLSLTVPFFKIISIPILGIMVIFAAMSFNDFRKAKQPKPIEQIGITGSQLQKTSGGKGKYHALMVILIATIAAPVIAIGGMILLLIIFLAAGGGKGS